MPLLPPVPDPEAFQAVRRADIYGPALAEIARRHRLRGTPRRYAAGSLPVFALGDEHVVKLFAPPFRRNRDNERGALEFLAGRLEVPTPALRASDDLDGWPYLVMSQLAGERFDEVWPSLGRLDQLRIAGEVGRMLAALHRLPAAGAAVQVVDWDSFVAAQRAACVAHQARRGADPVWLARIPDFLALLDLRDRRGPVFLHTEVMPDHLLVTRDGRLAGLVDFEPSMIGAREYEFAAVGLFLAAGDSAVLRAVLDGYGLAIDPALQRRLLGYALLHRYSSLRWYLERLPPRAGVDTLEGLAAQWFAAI